MKPFIPVIAAAVALAACTSTGGFHDAVKLQAAGIGFNPTTGVTAGYLGATIDRSQNVDKTGAPIVVPGCNGKGSDSPDTYANLNSNAKASATSVLPGSAGGVNAPQIAWASGDTTANGQAAIVAAAAGTANPADTIASICNNQALPSATAGSVVRDGVAPH